MWLFISILYHFEDFQLVFSPSITENWQKHIKNQYNKVKIENMHVVINSVYL